MFQYLTLIGYGHFSFLEVLVCPRESGWENVIPTHILILFDLIHSNICLIPFDVFFVSDMWQILIGHHQYIPYNKSSMLKLDFLRYKERFNHDKESFNNYRSRGMELH